VEKLNITGAAAVLDITLYPIHVMSNLGVDGGVGAGGAVDGSADHPHQEGALLPLPGPPDRPRQHQRPAGVSLAAIAPSSQFFVTISFQLRSFGASF